MNNGKNEDKGLTIDSLIEMDRNQRKHYSTSEYYRSTTDEAKFVLVNKQTKTKEVVGKHIVTKYLGETWRELIYDADFLYRPDVNKVSFTEAGRIRFNTYAPPPHLHQQHWDNLSQTFNKRALDIKGLPQPYSDLFNHLFGNSPESLEYVLEWLAKALDVENGRNLTTLVLVSTPGTGKGVLFEQVIENLFGKSNTAIISGENAFVNQFNSQFADKQMILLDEAQLTSPATLNRFKALINDQLEVEKKGKDKYITKNWLNIIIASNNLNAVYIEEGDRRFSVVNMNNKMLIDTFDDVPKLIRELTNPDNIANLYTYLRELDSKRDMNRPFVSSKLAEIKDAGLKDWERTLLEYLNEKLARKITIVDIKDFQEYLSTKLGNRVIPGHVRIKAVSTRFPEIFRVRQRKSDGARLIEVLAKYDTSAFDKEELLTDDELELLNSNQPYSVSANQPGENNRLLKLNINKNKNGGI